MNPKSDGKNHCLVAIDAFLHFFQVYPVNTTNATHTIEAMSTFRISFGIVQKLVFDRGTSFMSTDFSTFLLDLGITQAPRTKWSPWTIGIVEIQSKHLSRSLRCNLSIARNNWAKLACQFAFAHNTSVKSSTRTTPYEIVCRSKPQIPISLKLGLVRDDNDICQSEFCQSLPKHTHVNKQTSHSCIDILLSSIVDGFTELRNSIQKSKNLFHKVYRKGQAPPIAVEAEVLENSYSEIEFDSGILDNEGSDKDSAFNRKIEDSQERNQNSTPSIFLYMNQTRHCN